MLTAIKNISMLPINGVYTTMFLSGCWSTHLHMGRYLKILTLFRNVCAHNERLYSFRIQIDFPDTVSKPTCNPVGLDTSKRHQNLPALSFPLYSRQLFFPCISVIMFCPQSSRIISCRIRNITHASRAYSIPYPKTAIQ